MGNQAVHSFLDHEKEFSESHSHSKLLWQEVILAFLETANLIWNASALL